eukprot:m.29281 g.29281  ORF g.29281 m.29281 type:complete len:286 (-) comp16070_c0_seq1:203-1060(-)
MRNYGNSKEVGVSSLLRKFLHKPIDRQHTHSTPPFSIVKKMGNTMATAFDPHAPGPIGGLIVGPRHRGDSNGSQSSSLARRDSARSTLSSDIEFCPPNSHVSHSTPFKAKSKSRRHPHGIIDPNDSGYVCDDEHFENRIISTTPPKHHHVYNQRQPLEYPQYVSQHHQRHRQSPPKDHSPCFSNIKQQLPQENDDLVDNAADDEDSSNSDPDSEQDDDAWIRNLWSRLPENFTSAPTKHSRRRRCELIFNVARRMKLPLNKAAELIVKTEISNPKVRWDTLAPRS